MTNFSDVDEKMSDKLSECDDARVINNQLLSYIISKCAGNVVLLCDVLKNVVSTDKKKQLHDLGIVIILYQAYKQSNYSYYSAHITVLYKVYALSMLNIKY